ncbi:hypothetical protein PDENDC454_00855 [Paenibacillus dendritiformis C454]|uniref:Uncharacterized protein n=1 Tax=Paenibacillus dendritiformis C454 TaxID=1131935 RepID=H3S9H1_9BACL|nr:hypothetical protein PDENDC454_00855 [Paenibacillus dendritiformis C454]
MKGERRLGILRNYSILSIWPVESGEFLHGRIILSDSPLVQAITGEIAAFLQDSLARIAGAMRIMYFCSIAAIAMHTLS